MASVQHPQWQDASVWNMITVFLRLTIGIMLNIDQRELFAEMLGTTNQNLAHNRFPADFEPPNATGFSLWD